MKNLIKIILLIFAWYIIMVSNLPLIIIFLLGVLAGYTIPVIVDKSYSRGSK